MRSWSRAKAGLFLSIVIANFGCGKPVEPGYLDGAIPVSGGGTAWGTDCPTAGSSTPTPIELGGWECGTDKIELAAPIPPMIIKADCSDMSIRIRSPDRNGPDGNYVIPVDGVFSISVDGVTAKLKNDGRGHTDCTSYIRTELDGRIHCRPNSPNSDQVVIELQARYWLSQGKPPSGANTSNRCTLPQDCRLYAESRLRQCQ